MNNITTHPLLSAIIIAFMTVSVMAENQRVFKAYPISSTDPQSVAQAAQGMVGTNGTVYYDKGGAQLLVFAPAELHKVVADLMSTVNIPTQNIQLEVAFIEAGENSEHGAKISGSGKIVVTPSGTSGKIKITPEIKSQTSTSSSTTRQLLVMRNGGEASLAVGNEVAIIEPFIVLGRQWGLIQPEIEVKNVGAFLSAQATVLGDGPLISVKLTPELSALVDGKPQRIKYTKVSTEITVSDGETVTIGSFGENKDFYDKFLLGLSSRKNATSLNITLTARIMSPSGK